MKFIELEQGTDEWHEWRASRYTASQAGAIMGVSPFWPRTPFQLYQMRTGQKEVEVTDAMRAGSRDEGKARAHIAWHAGEVVVPACAETVLAGMPMGASLDAVCFEFRRAWEIKRPQKGSASDLWAATEAPPYYLWQMVHTLICAPIDEVQLSVYAHDLDQVKTVDVLFRDSDRYRALEAQLVKGWATFHGYLEQLIPPPLTEADEVLLDDSDEEWKEACDALQLAQGIEAATAKALETAKARVIELAQARGEGCKVRGCGFQVFRVEKAGNINWKAKPILAALKAAEVDPEAFRAKPTAYWSVREG